MAFTQLRTTQNQFLEEYLRGTGRTMSAAQARDTYGIKNIRARMTEMRQAGLRVRRNKNDTGLSAYAVSRRDVAGFQDKRFA